MTAESPAPPLANRPADEAGSAPGLSSPSPSPSPEEVTMRRPGLRDKPWFDGMALGLGGLLVLGFALRHFGLWDPQETAQAELARRLATGGHLPEVRPLGLLWTSLGIRLFGASELAVRLPQLVAGLLVLGATFWSSRRLFSRRAAFLSAAFLLACPSFVFGSRAPGTDMLSVASLTLLPGLLARGAKGLARFAVLASLFIVAGLGAGGLVGVVAPAFGLLLAAAFSSLPQGQTRAAALAGPIAAAAVGLLVVGLWPGPFGMAFWGSLPVPMVGRSHADGLRHVGYGLFPLLGLLPGAVAVMLSPAPNSTVKNGMEAGRQAALLIVMAMLVGYLVVERQSGTEMACPLFGLASLLVAGLFDRLLPRPRDGDAPDAHAPLTRNPLLGLAVGTALLLIARDLFLAPVDLFVPYLRDRPRWPAYMDTNLHVGGTILVASALVAGLVCVGISMVGAWRRRLLYAAVAVAGLYSLVVVYGFGRVLSTHWSFRGVFDRFQALTGGSDTGLARYRISADTVAFYAQGNLEGLASPQEVLDRLAGKTGGGGCRYVLVAGEELGTLDKQLRNAQIAYYVVDASSSRFLLLSSCLPQGEKDHNPLRRFVRTTPPEPPPSRALKVDWEDKVELIGIDVPPVVSRLHDGKIELTLYFHVKAPVPGGQKVFVHLDGCGERLHGDHVPLDGKFPTHLWSPGDYITDKTVIDTPTMTTAACRYRILLGFFAGDQRLKLTPIAPGEGGAGGATVEPGNTNRAFVGTVEVR